MVDKGYCWCPQCMKWVPEKLMNYDKGVRVCTPCLEATSDQNNFVLDIHHEHTKCIYCDSYDTVEQQPKWLWFKCNTCGATFRRL